MDQLWANWVSALTGVSAAPMFPERERASKTDSPNHTNAGKTYTPVDEWYVSEKSLIQATIADALRP